MYEIDESILLQAQAKVQAIVLEALRKNITSIEEPLGEKLMESQKLE